jgi:hypothetical protein
MKRQLWLFAKLTQRFFQRAGDRCVDLIKIRWAGELNMLKIQLDPFRKTLFASVRTLSWP